jgi:molybdopterin-containing oxidoreductase family membrane subunit
MYDSPIRELLITGKKTYTQVTTDIVNPILNPPTKGWLFGFGLSAIALALGLYCMTYTLFVGIGSWGLNKTVGWAFDITNFVFWVGIGHAGTLISAILLLFRQKWRTGVNRAAEAMTIFAVICAALFPGLHMGRPWLAYWIFPLPNYHGPLWINFNSPLAWDVFAISTYFSVSLLFWYSGLIPDFATVRDRAKTKLVKNIYNGLAFGWVGSAKNWVRFEALSLILAGVSTPLVLSVHTIVSMDFATSVIPGWHTTIFPPYFVAGAIFSGFGMVLTLMTVVRSVMKLEDYITIGHIEAMCKVVVATGMMVGLAYGTEFFIAFYSGSPYETYTFYNRAFGPYGWSYWIMVSCNVISPQLFWFKKIRQNMVLVFIISIFVNIGMWFERFVIIVTSLHRDLVPSSWFMYTPTFIEFGIFIGTLGVFFTFFFLFAKFFPVIAIAEVKSVMRSSSDTYRTDHIKESQLEEAFSPAKGYGTVGGVATAYKSPEEPQP